MIFESTNVDGALLVSLEPRGDDRGYFARAWCATEAGDAGGFDTVAQINMSLSADVGLIRGLHWQEAPHEEGKFMRCIRGRIFDVCVDVRPESPTFMQWTGAELTPQNRQALLIPPGCAHGYQALEPNSEVLYLASSPYAPGVERGLRWNDPGFAIDWPITDGVIVSEKDEAWPDFEG